MAISDYLSRETVQMALILIVTLGFHYYFIRNRLMSMPDPKESMPNLQPPETDEDDEILYGKFPGSSDPVMR